MWTIIKSFFAKKKYYIKAVRTGETDVVWQMEVSDIIQLFVKTEFECDVVRLKGDYTLFVGKR